MNIKKRYFTLFSATILSVASSVWAADANQKVIIGSADFPENQLLATIYAGALEAQNIPVEKKLNIGSREVYIPALLDGSINVIPEYSGALLSYLDEKNQAHSSEDVIRELEKKLPEKVKMLTPAAAQNSDILAVTKKTADKYNLKTIDDLKPIAGELVLGGPAEWKTRHEGVSGLRDVYGLQFKSFKVLDVAGPLTLTALKNNQIQVADLTSTTPEIKKDHLVALVDTKHLFAAQNIVPIVASSTLNPTIESTLNKISAQLTTEDLIAMNEQLAEFVSIDDVAHQWLVKQGLSK
ncbi:ABC transporter substrate-binding protein [Pectobacterium polaris]|uniref:ABC transporter substrate-binding protein n=1 Tax=Pectobacterium polaris TaxID=2042057 RepID=A0AAW5GA04_9GAMM|nr:ABC transporter substrate-binding protein [Pectobacterium polaris]ASY78019.1 glycine/betaine ABC transporter substrate-binding protein [Pectobacterium polaris]MBW5893205.1 ABC transporter substrate-binding protein [Pectobacterium polaris]MCA6952060.1 ABC transporter substrate-binding protein [Pectobacterium polaris]MCL6350456.1 ABC transporter substrate-binding protein [Pectobacterium polaris]MCL6358547.1 ABC transporter substrate-binding protein [Pectobacterium polaris]